VLLFQHRLEARVLCDQRVDAPQVNLHSGKPCLFGHIRHNRRQHINQVPWAWLLSVKVPATPYCSKVACAVEHTRNTYLQALCRDLECLALLGLCLQGLLHARPLLAQHSHLSLLAGQRLRQRVVLNLPVTSASTGTIGQLKV
jgi:hypothetical protein